MKINRITLDGCDLEGEEEVEQDMKMETEAIRISEPSGLIQIMDSEEHMLPPQFAQPNPSNYQMRS